MREWHHEVSMCAAEGRIVTSRVVSSDELAVVMQGHEVHFVDGVEESLKRQRARSRAFGWRWEGAVELGDVSANQYEVPSFPRLNPSMVSGVHEKRHH
jgi:hypothetical protein